MKSSAIAVGILSCLLGTAAVPSAQLGDVAKKEAERRKTVKAAGKTYTNDNLKPEPLPSAPPVSSSGAASSEDAPAPAPAPAPSESSPAPAAPPSQSGVSSDPETRKQDEAMWRERIKTERDALERAKTFADALQSKINALNTDFVNRDDPSQRAAIASDRDKSLAELERLKKEIAQHTKAIADIQAEARKAGVPAGWVR
jgi:hypothetical protein